VGKLLGLKNYEQKVFFTKQQAINVMLFGMGKQVKLNFFNVTTGIVMKIRILVLLIITHGAIFMGGFALGIYALPILIAPPAPSESEVKEFAAEAEYSAEFRKDLKDSDGLHWGEGTVSLSTSAITFMGELSPGPDYKLYLSPEFIETEVDFNQLKAQMIQVGEIKTFDNFVVNLPEGVILEEFNSVIVWCETFGEFITSAKYR
jgi:hypothetical protein